MFLVVTQFSASIATAEFTLLFLWLLRHVEKNDAQISGNIVRENNLYKIRHRNISGTTDPFFQQQCFGLG